MTEADEIEFENPICAVCGSARRSTLYAFDDPYTVVQCIDCRMHYLFPRLTEVAMRRLYEEDSYFEGGESGYSDTGYGEQERALRSTFARLMFNLRKRGLSGGTLLEIGCGYGYLLEEARGFFDRRVGTEFSSEGVRLSATKADQVYHGGIEAVPDGVKFDCIIATQVIEHVYEPLHFVEKIIEHASRNASVVLAAPDMGGILRKAMGRRWASFKMPEHIHYFDAKSLGRLMSDAGLTEIMELPYPHAFPLSLIASKLGLPFPAAIGNMNLWIPSTTVALCGKVPNEG